MTAATPATLYFHGWPGSGSELASFGEALKSATRDWHVVDRSAGASGADRVQTIVHRIERSLPSGPIRLVGFSLGAAVALQVSPYLAERITGIDLVSPAAPLTLGDFLPGMAGAPVFRAAIAGRWPFALLTGVQALAARLAPTRMAGALMSRARGADARLATDPVFLAALSGSLQSSLLGGRQGYATEILLYVADWSARLAEVCAPVTIWQGTEDDWTPPAMARALAARLPDCARVEWCDGLSHFSTLRAYLAGQAQ